MQPDQSGFAGLENFEYFVTDPSFSTAVLNTVWLLGSVILITVVVGIAIALLINDPFPGRGVVRVLLISPFFVMPTVNALMWKNMMMNPIYGVLAQVWMFFGAQPVDWLTDYPLFSVIVMVSWQWLPFATLIFMTSLQSMNHEQLEAARMDGATYLQQLRYLYLPHLGRSVAVVVMIELIFCSASLPRSTPPRAVARAMRAPTSPSSSSSRHCSTLMPAWRRLGHCLPWCWPTSRRCS